VLLNVFVPVLIAITVFLIVIGMFRTKKNFLKEKFEKLDVRKYKFNGNKNIREDSFFNRVVKPYLEKIANITDKVNNKALSKENVENKLVWAGNPYGLSAEQFMGIKVVLLVLFPVLVFVYYVGSSALTFISIMLILVSAIVGYFLPDFLLNDAINKRNLAIRKELPSVLDIISVSSDAGLDFISAVQKMVDKKEGELPDEFEIFLYDMNVGESRSKALNDLAYRCHVNSVTKFVNAINQSEKYGTSVSKVLKSQSDFVRETLKNEGEEKVQTAQSKLIIPLVIFALPAVFIILLGPAALEFFA